MSLIARFMPEYELVQVDRIAVAAAPELAYRAARHLDTQALPISRALFRLRNLPDRLHGHPASAPEPMTVDAITRPGSGFLLLAEQAGREFVVGSVGKFWLPRIEFAATTPDAFERFGEPGWGKLVWGMRVDSRIGGGAWITIEVRVTATDADSLAEFRRYWRVVGRFSHLIRKLTLKKLARELGAGVPDAARHQPGDDSLPEASLEATHAIDIEAPPERVWPWLVQMGCQRAGWYSYDWLDNARIPSARAIIPELQRLKVGDVLPARPHGSDGFAVLSIEPLRSLVLGSPELLPGAAGRRSPYASTWAFCLQPIGTDASRLVVRARAFSESAAVRAALRALVGPVHELMQREQLANLKRRAEAHAP